MTEKNSLTLFILVQCKCNRKLRLYRAIEKAEAMSL